MDAITMEKFKEMQELKKMTVRRISRSDVRVMMEGGVPGYFVLAPAHTEIKEGDIVRYVKCGLNYGRFTGKETDGDIGNDAESA